MGAAMLVYLRGIAKDCRQILMERWTLDPDRVCTLDNPSPLETFFKTRINESSFTSMCHLIQNCIVSNSVHSF